MTPRERHRNYRLATKKRKWAESEKFADKFMDYYRVRSLSNVMLNLYYRVKSRPFLKKAMRLDKYRYSKESRMQRSKMAA